MRQVIKSQMTLGTTGIGHIEFDPQSRDDIPQILRGLQFIWITVAVRLRVFEILQTILPDGVSGKANPDVGRPGMTQWEILVLGVLRLALNADYDRIHELANQHATIRQMLGHSDWLDKTPYELQTIKDNLRLFTPEILAQINQVVVEAGHALVNKDSVEEQKEADTGEAATGEKLHARVDSFVVETDVEYPTDLNLLQTAIQKVIKICAMFCLLYGLTDWRQSGYLSRQFKKAYTAILRLRHSSSKDEEKRTAKRDEINGAYRAHLEKAEELLKRARDTRNDLIKLNILPFEFKELDEFIAHAERQIDQIRRRVLQGETIPHKEKVFSLHEPHTEWVMKGKAGVPVELGIPVAIVEDQHGFILHHQVMEQTSDSEVAVPLIRETKELFQNLSSASFDKGFHSLQNQIDLTRILDRVTLPKKGKLSEKDKEREYAPEFIEARRQHPAIESAINALEVHGLDRCFDHGIDGFKR